MKTALELIGNDACIAPRCVRRVVGWCNHDMDLVVQRAREEMREAAANEALMNRETMANLYSKIRALPVKP